METRQATRLFMSSRNERMLSGNTVDLYWWALDKLTKEFPGELPLTRTEIHQLFDANAHLAWASQRTIWDRLRIFWAWLNEHGEVESNPMLEMPSPLKRRRVPRVLSADDIERLLNSVEVERGPRGVDNAIGHRPTGRRVDITDAGQHTTGRIDRRWESRSAGRAGKPRSL